MIWVIKTKYNIISVKKSVLLVLIVEAVLRHLLNFTMTICFKYWQEKYYKHISNNNWSTCILVNFEVIIVYVNVRLRLNRCSMRVTRNKPQAESPVSVSKVHVHASNLLSSVALLQLRLSALHSSTVVRYLVTWNGLKSSPIFPNSQLISQRKIF